uniref:Uncharacterized protein n=1 Tax=Wuchereria bancrofti TaxID=6293 RepID=A0AAF5Q5E6_WUCBA
MYSHVHHLRIKLHHLSPPYLFFPMDFPIFLRPAVSMLHESNYSTI